MDDRLLFWRLGRALMIAQAVNGAGSMRPKDGAARRRLMAVLRELARHPAVGRIDEVRRALENR